MARKNSARTSTKSIWLQIISFLITTASITVLVMTAMSMEEQTVMAIQANIVKNEPRETIADDHFPLLPDENEDKLISSMNAVKLTNGVDFDVDDVDLSSKLDTIIFGMLEIGLNTILLDTAVDEYKVLYSSEILDTTSVDVLDMLLKKGYQYGIGVIPIFHVNGRMDNTGNLLNQLVYNDRYIIVDAIRELASYPSLKAITLNSYYQQKNGVSYTYFMNEVNGLGDYDQWLYDNTYGILERLAYEINVYGDGMATGIAIDDVWANVDVNDLGLETTYEFSALYDGYSDTKAIIENGIVDYAIVDIPSTQFSTDLPYQATTEWWGNVCDAGGVPLYVIHNVYNATRSGVGTDQLARQILYSQVSESYSGSIFNGIELLLGEEQTKNILIQKLEDEYADEDLLSDLTLSLPTSRNYTTYDTHAQFRGNFDPNQEVLLNGVSIVPTERGGFSEWIELNVGMNYITLEHKGKVVTYQIERKVVPITSIAPTTDMNVAGGSVVEINATVFRGSNVTATLNGVTVQLKEGGGAADDANGENLYANYQGSITVPKAENEDVDLGRISVYGEYMGYTSQLYGANIIVDKIPDEVDPDEATGKSFIHATVTSLYANTYPYQTTPLYAQGILYPLPQGATDIVTSISGDYVHLRSGKTVHINSVSVSEEIFVGNNSISQFSLGVEGNDTVVRATLGWQAPMTIELDPYPTDTDQILNNTFNSTTVKIILDYTTRADVDNFVANLSGNPLFSAISHERVYNETINIWQYEIVLTLAEAGKYYGCHVTYVGNELVIRFNNPPTNQLNGITIVIDPGHGGDDPGTMAGKDLLEKEAIDLLYPKIVSELQALGATVLLTRDGDYTISNSSRTELGQKNYADMLLSIHYNSADQYTAPNGPETYFNTPFSRPLADNIQPLLEAVLGSSDWTRVKYYNFYQAREKQFPSVLLEIGYLSNSSDEAKAMDDASLNKVAKAIAQGVLNYYY